LLVHLLKIRGSIHVRLCKYLPSPMDKEGIEEFTDDAELLEESN
jgi:hypothetical protein